MNLTSAQNFQVEKDDKLENTNAYTIFCNDHGYTLLAAMVMELWMFNFFFPHCQEDFTPDRQPRRCWFNPVKSDYGGDPDDQQVMVRYLLDDLVTSPWRCHDGFEKRSDSMLGTLR